MAEKRPPITCHVLDTTIGKPAAHIPVTLTLLPSGAATSPIASRASFSSPATTSYAAVTNADGRVTNWIHGLNSPKLESLWEREQGDLKWCLSFQTEDYFAERGVKAFFNEVEVKFVVREGERGEHFHVPVLLGPFGFTTYRGS